MFCLIRVIISDICVIIISLLRIGLTKDIAALGPSKNLQE